MLHNLIGILRPEDISQSLEVMSSLSALQSICLGLVKLKITGLKHLLEQF